MSAHPRYPPDIYPLNADGNNNIMAMDYAKRR